MNKVMVYIFNFSFVLLLVMLAKGASELLIINTNRVSINSNLLGLSFGLPYLSTLIGKREKIRFKRLIILIFLYYFPLKIIDLIGITIVSMSRLEYISVIVCLAFLVTSSYLFKLKN